MENGKLTLKNVQRKIKNETYTIGLSSWKLEFWQGLVY